MKLYHLVIIVFWFVAISLIYLHTTDSFDQDLGRHIKLGEIILAEKQVPKTNLFSYTNPSEPVFNSHWGSQVFFYLINKNLGVPGLILTSTFFNTLAFGLLFLLAVRRTGVFIPSLLFVPFSLLLLDRVWIRPEMFSNLFYAILLLTVFIKRIRRFAKWTMPVMVFLWVNLHISFILGVFVIGIVLLQDTIEAKNRARTIIVNVAILVTVILALTINPYGLQSVISAFSVLSKYGYTIIENQSWFFLKDFGFPLVGHIFFGFIILIPSFLLTKRKPTFSEIALLITISILTLRFVRNETFFAYTAFLISALNFANPRLLVKEYSSPFSRFGIIASLILLILSFFLIVSANSNKRFLIDFMSREKYKNGVDFFLNNKMPGPILNNFDIGGYLIYRLYPQYHVFVDNRPEAYPADFFQKIYIPLQEDPKLFREVSRQYGIKTIIWAKEDITPWSQAFLANLIQDREWKLVYVDNATIIYSK